MENRLNVEYIPVGKLKPYDKNTRKHAEYDVSQIAKSIEQYGFNDPIGIWGKDNIIVEGHGRLLAAKKMSMAEVPCIRLDDLTDEQRREYAIMHNKTAELSAWDFDLLAAEIDGLDFSGFDIDWGLPTDEEETEITEDEPPEVDEEPEPICQLGDIWQLGEHRLMCGDSTDKGTIERLLGEQFGKVDLVLTDPPYNVAYNGKTKKELKIENDAMSSEQFENFLHSSFVLIEEILKNGGVFYIWHASRSQREFENALNSAGLEVRQQLIWVKNSMVLGRQDYQWRHEPCFYGWKEGAHDWESDRKQTTVLEFDRPTANREHPTMKPISLIAYQIKNSTKKGEIVFDGFGGSGSTLIACEQTGRKCYTCELDPRYADVIIKRYENLTGQKAVKL